MRRFFSLGAIGAQRAAVSTGVGHGYGAVFAAAENFLLFFENTRKNS